MEKGSVNKIGSIFELDGVPPVNEIVPLGFQHVVAAIVVVVTPEILVANITNMG